MSQGRIVAVSEDNLVICIKNSIWGSNFNRFKQWKDGQIVFFSIDSKLAAFGKVVGEYYYDLTTRIWTDAAYSYRIKIKFEHTMPIHNRLPIAGKIKQGLIKCWGKRYGWGIVSQRLLPEALTALIIKEMQKSYG